MRRYNTSTVCGRLQSATTKKKKRRSSSSRQLKAMHKLKLSKDQVAMQACGTLIQLHYYTGLGPFTN